MLEEENFKKAIEEQKVIIWKNNYINYDLLKTELDTIIEKNKNDIKGQVKEIKEIKEISPEHVKAKKIEIRKNKNISVKEEKLVLPSDTTIIENKEKKVIEISFNRLAKNFLNLLDKEVDSFIEFFKTEESQLYKQMNLQISNYMNSKQDDDKKLEIVHEFEYSSNLCKELINYVYLNIKVLLRILNFFDNMFTNISFDYIKKYLSEGKLTYVLNFKTIDKCLVSIDDILTNIDKIFARTNYFRNNINEENKYKENKNKISKNIKDSNDIHEKVFIELKKWEKYLNIQLELPISNNESIFANTSFIGDSILFEEGEIDRKGKKKLNYFEVEENNDNNIENNDKFDLVLKGQLIVDFGVLFDPKDTFSSNNNKVLTSHNIGNLQLIIKLAGFYSYSYILLVPDIIIFLFDYSTSNNNPDNKNISYQEELYLYGIAISIPLIGNLIAKKIYEKYCSKFLIKYNIIVSLIFITSYYIFSYLGIIYNKSILNIIFIIIGRLFLGLSYLKQITKTYLDNYVPRSHLVRLNEKYNVSIYKGYIIGLLINALGFLHWKRNDKFHSNLIYASIIIGLSFNYSIVNIISIYIQFKEINNDISDNKAINLNKKNEDENNLIENIDFEEDEDNNDENNGKDNNHLLTNYVNKNRIKKGKYFKIIVFVLLFSLFTSQYISENLLLLLPRLLTYNYLDKKKNNINEKSNYLIIIPLFSSLSYLISYYIQRIYLKNSYYQKNKMFIIILMLIFMNIFSITFSFLCIDLSKLDLNPYNIIPTVGFFVLIVLNELYHTMSINFFIQLLPTENMKLGLFSSSAFINVITKIARLIPSFIFLSFYIIYKIKIIKEKVDDIFIGENITNFKKYNNRFYINICNSIIFGIQLIFLLLNLIIVICFKRYLKNMPLNRLLGQN